MGRTVYAAACRTMLLLGVLVAPGMLDLSPAQAQQRRMALVIGNSAYRSVAALDNPRNDAKLMAGVLSALGFELVGGGAQLDLDRPALVRAIGMFKAALRPGTIAVFYYSGHGLQVDGTNFLVPVDAHPASLADVDAQMVDAGAALTTMERSGAGLKVLILDACRNNPFAARGLRSPGLAEMHAPRGTIISYATQPGGVASDGVAGGRDSPYTTALAQSLRMPGLEIVKAFNQVGLLVARATDDRQEPWLALSPLEGDVYLAGRSGDAASAAIVAQPPVPSDTATRDATMPAPVPASPAPVQATTNLPSELGRRYFGRH